MRQMLELEKASKLSKSTLFILEMRKQISKDKDVHVLSQASKSYNQACLPPNSCLFDPMIIFENVQTLCALLVKLSPLSLPWLFGRVAST